MPFRDDFTDCPRCRIALEPITLIVGGLDVLRCKQCDGMWTSLDDFRALTVTLAPHGQLHETFRDEPEAPLHCPECKGEMTKLYLSQVPVDRCQHGLWFDFAELQRVLTQLRD